MNQNIQQLDLTAIRQRAYTSLDADELQRDVLALCNEVERWLKWSGGERPDESPGDVIAAESDGTIILDDGITTWNPLRAARFFCDEVDRCVR